MAERRARLGTILQCASLMFVMDEVSWPLSNHPLNASAS